MKPIFKSVRQGLYFGYYSYILFLLIPTLLSIILALGFDLIPGLGVIESVLLLLGNLPILIYVIFSSRRLQLFKKSKFGDEEFFPGMLNFLYYVGFLALMATMLLAFNAIFIGGFLITDQAPIGMDLTKKHSLPLILTGVGLILVTFLTMYYFVQSRKLLKLK